MERVLITGAAGFIGSHVLNYLYDKYPKAEFYNLDAMYYCADHNRIRDEIRDSARYHFVKGDLCQYDLLYHLFSSHKFTHVIHFAAQSHVDNSFSNPLQYTHDNILGTHTLLEVAKTFKSSLKLFVHVSTDEVYGESGDSCKTEQSVLCPTNPYAATKAGAELIAQSYRHSYGMPIIITRGNNVYGPKQYPEKVIPKFIEQLKNDTPVTIHGDGSALRAFVHVRDVARAFYCILEKGVVGEIYNVGTDTSNEYSVTQVAHYLIHLIKNIPLDDTDNLEKWMTRVDDRLYNDNRYFINTDKMTNLGWTPEIDFLTGLRELTKI